MGHKHKDKYITIKDIYKSIKNTFNKYYLFCEEREKKVYKSINYKLYYSIIKRFFEILIRDAAERDHKVYLPNFMGYVRVDEKPHTRAFHTRIDNEATKKQGKTIFYNVPILDDYYKKLVWVRPPKYKSCKLMPLRYLKEIINKN